MRIIVGMERIKSGLITTNELLLRAFNSPFMFTLHYKGLAKSRAVVLKVSDPFTSFSWIIFFLGDRIQNILSK